MKRRTRKQKVQFLAKERVARLWELAEPIAVEQPERASAWMRAAKRIAQKARIKLPTDVSRRICRGCGAVLVPGYNCRYRMRGNRSTHLTMTCLKCGTKRRFYARRQA